mgnify:CR=1 FL=1
MLFRSGDGEDDTWVVDERIWRPGELQLQSNWQEDVAPDGLLGSRWATTVGEFGPPTAAGATALTLADNSLAILRVANTAAATLLRERLGVTSVIHLACRDKNLIGLQSELMGLAALGHRHVLALTGDPSKFGDHPGATSVYDVNSLGLIDLIRQLNEGRNSAGREVGKGAEFVIGVAFNPNSKNFDAQVKKLERKMERGAHFVMTQPVYEKSMIRKMKEALSPLGIPVLVGVMPVISARNAEFLHHEVPGISIPEEVRAKIRSLPEGPAQAEYGREVAAELAREVAQHFRGIYLITPMVRSGMTARIQVGDSATAKPGTVCIPLSALVTFPPDGPADGKSQLGVFVVQENKALKRAVKTGDILDRKSTRLNSSHRT